MCLRIKEIREIILNLPLSHSFTEVLSTQPCKTLVLVLGTTDRDSPRTLFWTPGPWLLQAQPALGSSAPHFLLFPLNSLYSCSWAYFQPEVCTHAWGNRSFVLYKIHPRSHSPVRIWGNLWTLFPRGKKKAHNSQCCRQFPQPRAHRPPEFTHRSPRNPWILTENF